ncbi:MAG: hypothetical protein JWO74_4724 [Solirubrobacterales bacterium]|jgi:hypothetical protein|nr:hypothetical protein [Solirubrobacterales bacterium]
MTRAVAGNTLKAIEEFAEGRHEGMAQPARSGAAR